MSMTEGNRTGDGERTRRYELAGHPSAGRCAHRGPVAALLLFTFADIWFATQRSTEGMASAAVVLGAAQYDGTPSPVLLRRLDEAASLYDLEDGWG